jgi:GNAT superfamily N-acetyltransferase
VPSKGQGKWQRLLAGALPASVEAAIADRDDEVIVSAMSSSGEITFAAFGDEGPELAALLVGERYFEARSLAEQGGEGGDPLRELWVIRVAGGLSGLLVLDLDPSGQGAELSIVVVPARRRFGVARAAVDFARRRCRELRRARLRAIVHRDNHAAERLFASSGFARQDGGPTDHVLLECTIAEISPDEPDRSP